MRRGIAFILTTVFIMTFTAYFSAVKRDGDKDYDDMKSIFITIGDSVFSAKLYNNDSANALLAMLPMTLDMSELNRNEKYYYLSDNLPTDSQRVGNINAGDLMLYSSNCLVIFYEGLITSYSYTKLGYIEEVSGLADALGTGSIRVTFAVAELKD